MKINRTKNAIRNIVFGGILRIYQIVFPFIMRTVMIYFMGVQYLGLNSLFTSVLQVLNLAELGVGSAMVYSMYKPITEDDQKTICALMRLYRTYYRMIGLIIAIAGIALTPFIPKLIKSDLPAGINIYILYLLNLSATVLSYWLFAYKNCLLQAHQRVDVTSKVTLITSTFQYLIQIFVVIVLKNYYIFVIVMLGTQAMTNIITSIVVTKMYPSYNAKGELPKEMVTAINHRIRDLFTSKIGAVIVNSADTIVISAFLGLTILAIYQNYFYILSAIISVGTIIFSACTAGIGNSLIVESKEKNYSDLKKFTFMLAWFSGFCTVCLLCLYQPLMDIWVGKDLELQFPAIVCFCIYYFVYEINQLLNLYKDAAGIWHEDRFRTLITALSNLAMNLIMVQFWGIYGVILSTVLSTVFIGMPWLLHNLFTVLFNKSQLVSYLKKLMLYVIVTCIGCIITYSICTRIYLTGWSLLVVRLIICCIVPNLIFLIFYRRISEFEDSISMIKRIIKKKL
ncbi:MAG: polysaccharide biosynthesis protein [Anaerobutyricum hallii]|uniref:polysaccharide biosynthesis protein n=1 Tax=Anaerobutyricum hallii TaxID=39488 RepID=UPI002A8219C9|nr:polysaccharide biosynthesis protein [Anaerobutyricum hallii]MDY4576586.1 polysaccharide biosynthesis protein [Anaerobutyricum hallii]